MLKVSVIIPVYNVEKYLSICLDSVVNQTLKDIEIICINDCSTDNSLGILQNYAQKDERIKIINLEKNKGVSTARNKGIDIAVGEYIGFVDGDDYVDLDFYEKLYNEAQKNDSEVVKGEVFLLNTKNNISQQINQKIRENNKMYFTKWWTTAIYKTSLIKENGFCFLENISNGEDIVFLNKIVTLVKKIATIDNAIYYYNRHINSLDSISLSTKKIQDNMYAINIIISNLNKSLNKFINNNEYIYAYCFYFSFLFDALFRNNDKLNKKVCIDNIFSIYSKCLLKKELDKYIYENMPSIFQFILSNDKVNFYEYISSCKNYSQFIIKNIRFKQLNNKGLKNNEK